MRPKCRTSLIAGPINRAAISSAGLVIIILFAAIFSFTTFLFSCGGGCECGVDGSRSRLLTPQTPPQLANRLSNLPEVCDAGLTSCTEAMNTSSFQTVKRGIF